MIDTTKTYRFVASGFPRGHLILFDDISKEWLYADTLTPFDDSRPCPRCGRYPTPEGHDACLGTLPGIVSACCGHGVSEPYQLKEFYGETEKLEVMSDHD